MNAQVSPCTIAAARRKALDRFCMRNGEDFRHVARPEFARGITDLKGGAKGSEDKAIAMLPRFDGETSVPPSTHRPGLEPGVRHSL